MKKLLELRQEKTALKTRMRSIMDKTTEEKRNLNVDEGKQFDELRAKAESLDTDISRLEVLADEERSQPGKPVDGKKVSNDELRHYILTGETRALSTAVGVIPSFPISIKRLCAS